MTAPVPDHAALPVDQLRVTRPRLWVGGPEEFWSCNDGDEQLQHETLEDAVFYFVDGQLNQGPNFESLLRDLAPLEVYGYSRAGVSDQRLEFEAEELVGRFAERVGDDDEWGDPNGSHEVFDDRGQKALLPLIVAALKQVRHHVTPWHCEITKTIVLEADALVSLMRDLEPSWFEVTRG